MKRKVKNRLIIFVIMVSMVISLLPSGYSFAANKNCYSLAENVTGSTVNFSKAQGSVNLKSSNSFGKILAESINQKTDEQMENLGYNIYSVEIDEKEATVSLEILKECTVIVGIYSEDGKQMLASGDKDVSLGDNSVKLDINIDKMPEYFYIYAFLVETDTLNPLCTAYESSIYTKEMQDFLSQTTEDFDEDKVLNLDDDISDNYAVYSDKTKKINHTNNENKLVTIDEEADVYVIENADNMVTSLQENDVFSYETEDENVIISKVDDIHIDENTVTIYGTDVSAEEVFDYIKIDGSANNEDMSVDDSRCEEVKYEGKAGQKSRAKSGNGETGVEVEGTLKFKFLDKEIGEDKNKVKFSGGLNLKTVASIKVYFTPKRNYLEFRVDYSAKFGVGVSGKIAKEIPLAKLGFSPVFGVLIEFTPSFVIETSGEIDIGASLETTVGFRVNGKKFENITTKPQVELETKIEGKIFLGFSMSPKVKILSDKIAKVEMKAKVGGEIIGTYFQGPEETNRYIHTCSKCIDGDINGKISVNFNVVLANSKDLTFRLKILELKKELGDFYYSYEDNKIYFKECPNLKYKVVVAVKSPSGGSVEGVTVNKKYKTGSTGEAIIYLANGVHRIIVGDGAYHCSKTVTINKKPKRVEITVDYGKEEKTIVRSPLKGKKVKFCSMDSYMSTLITDNGDLYTWGQNIRGCLGNGTELNSSVPVKILENVKQVLTSGCFCMAVTNNGDLYTWGDNAEGQLGRETETYYCEVPVKIMEDVDQAVTNIDCAAAITKNGDLYTWGKNDYGCLGNGTEIDTYSPQKVLEKIREIYWCNSSYNCLAIATDSTLYTWGKNMSGCLGNGSNENSSVPVKILENVKKAKLHTNNGSAITETGDLYTWGDNSRGFLGNGSTVSSNKPLKVMENVVQYEISGWAAGALQENGNLYMWGHNWGYDLGGGKSTDYASAIPELLLNNVRWFSLGTINYAITKNDDLYDWGGNVVTKPIHADGLMGVRVTPSKTLGNVAEVLDSNVVLTNDGDLYQWGDNEYGQVGDGTTETVYKAKKILSNVIYKCEKYTNTSCGALTSEGKLFTWGCNKYSGFSEYGVLGNGSSPENVLVPMALGDSDVVMVMDNTYFTLKLYSDKESGKKEFSNLEPNSIYNIYIVKENLKQYAMVSDNLLYMKQAVSDENGNIVIEYEPKEKTDHEVAIIKGLTKKDIKESDISVSDLKYDFWDQSPKVTVSLDGIKLTGGTDYEIEGDVSGKDIGKYTISISGIGDYSGVVEREYQIYCEHKYKSWNTISGSTIQECEICGDRIVNNGAEQEPEGKPTPIPANNSKTSSNENNNSLANDSKDVANARNQKVTPPAKVKIKSAKNKRGRKLLVKWAKLKGVKGYQIQYSKNKKFKGKKSKFVKKTSVTLKRLTKKKKYYIRIRAYKMNGSKKVYGEWSSIKKVKITK